MKKRELINFKWFFSNVSLILFSEPGQLKHQFSRLTDPFQWFQMHWVEKFKFAPISSNGKRCKIYYSFYRNKFLYFFLNKKPITKVFLWCSICYSTFFSFFTHERFYDVRTKLCKQCFLSMMNSTRGLPRDCVFHYVRTYSSGSQTFEWYLKQWWKPSPAYFGPNWLITN